MKYVISIEETVVEEFEVDADSPEDVLAIASDKYYKEEFVLSPEAATLPSTSSRRGYRGAPRGRRCPQRFAPAAPNRR